MVRSALSPQFIKSSHDEGENDQRNRKMRRFGDEKDQLQSRIDKNLIRRRYVR